MQSLKPLHSAEVYCGSFLFSKSQITNQDFRTCNILSGTDPTNHSETAIKEKQRYYDSSGSWVSLFIHSVFRERESSVWKNKSPQKSGNEPSAGFVVPFMLICFPDSSWQVDKNKADSRWPQWVEQRQEQCVVNTRKPRLIKCNGSQKLKMCFGVRQKSTNRVLMCLQKNFHYYWVNCTQTAKHNDIFSVIM